MATEGTEFYKKKILDHYDLINRMVQKRFSDSATADEAFVFVMERLENDNWRRVREYKGNASFTTYLTKVVSNLILDYSDHKHGKFRPPEWVKKMGALWEEVHKRLCSERMSKKDVEFSMTIGAPDDRDPEAVREAIEIILAKVPDCGKYRKGKEYATDPDDLKNAGSALRTGTNTVPEQFKSALRYIALQNAVFPFFNSDSQNTDDGQENDNKLATAFHNFRSKLNLSAEDRLFLKMIYQDGLKVKTAGEKLNLKQNQIHRRHKKLLEHMGKAIKASGLEDELKSMLSDI